MNFWVRATDSLSGGGSDLVDHSTVILAEDQDDEALAFAPKVNFWPVPKHSLSPRPEP